MAYKPQNIVTPLGPHKAYPITAKSSAEVAVGALMDATGSAVAAAGSATVTLTIVDGDWGALTIGDYLDCDTGVSYERVQVTALNISAKTFTAVFANTHSANFTVRLTHGAFLGLLAIPQVGTAMTLDLWDGHPNNTGVSRHIFQWLTASGVIPGSRFDCVCDKGLYVVYNGTTAGWATISAMPMAR